MAQAPLRTDPGGRVKLLDMPRHRLCDPTGVTQEVLYRGIPTTWAEVVYHDSAGRHYGWVYAALLEDYDETDHPPIVSIPNQTTDPQDAAQYMIWRDQKQYNMCGELCVSFIAVADLGALLNDWQAKAINIFQRVFGSGGRARGTGLGELDSMLSIFGYPTPSIRLDIGLRDPILERPLVTPARIQSMLTLHQAIVGVKIDGATGNLRGSGIAHWVVLENVYPHGINRGMAEIYNPYHNQMQGYSWDELVSSMGSPYGLWVARR